MRRHQQLHCSRTTSAAFTIRMWTDCPVSVDTAEKQRTIRGNCSQAVQISWSREHSDKRTLSRMPSGRLQYTLAGFSPELDWRPLRFIKPIPQYKVCSACGIVRRKAALLPCVHTLCEQCYKQIGQDGTLSCPLDSQEFHEEDIEWKESPAEELLSREVRCWNEEAGCGALMSASGLIRHILNDCEHHCTSCQRCSATVLCSDVCAHLISDCKNLALADAPKGPQYPRDTATSTTFESVFHERVAEMRTGLRQVLNESKAQSQALSEVCHSMNTLREALGEKIAESEEKNSEWFRRNATDMRVAIAEEVKECLIAPTCMLNEISESLSSARDTLKQDIDNVKRDNCSKIKDNAVKLEAVSKDVRDSIEKTSRHFEAVLANISMKTSCSYFILEELNAKKGIVMENGKIEHNCQPTYLLGYRMAPGVCLRKKGDSVSFHIGISLYKGAIDDVLAWPFPHTLKISVIHPVTGEEKADKYKPEKKDALYFSRPAGQKNSSGSVNPHTLVLSDLERQGYAEDNRILLKYEVLRNVHF